jgi:hypothetical protein
LIRWFFENGRADEAFLAAHATGAQELRRRAEPWTIERAARAARVPSAQIEAFARLYADSQPAAIRCGWGLERNRNGGSAVAAVLALPAVAGKFGVRGGGYTLSNSKAWDLDARHAAGELPTNAAREVNMNLLGRTLLGENGAPVELLFVYNANPLATIPNQEKVREGLSREDLFTVVFDPVVTDTALYADVLLPATTFLERNEMSRGYGAIVLQESRPVIAPVGESRPNHEVFSDLTRRCGLARAGDPESAAEMKEAMFRGSPSGASIRESLDRSGIAFPRGNPASVQFVDAFPLTADRKIHLVADELDREAPHGLYAFTPEPETADYPLTLISPAADRTISSMLGELTPAGSARDGPGRRSGSRHRRGGRGPRLQRARGGPVPLPCQPFPAARRRHAPQGHLEPQHAVGDGGDGARSGYVDGPGSRSVLQRRARRGATPREERRSGKSAEIHGMTLPAAAEPAALPQEDRTTRKKSLLGALALTVAILVIEVAGGIFSHSLALLADAAHMFADIGALISPMPP